MLRYHNTTDQELLDQPGLSATDLYQNMAELDVINRWLGGHHTTLKGLAKLMTDKSRTYTIVDVGCGGGDMCRIVHQWAQSNGYKVKLIGLDNNAFILDYARAKTAADGPISYVLGSYQDLPDLVEKPDILITALFLHHLFADDLKRLLWVMAGYQKVGWVINDLQRHPFAYWGIKLLTSLFSRSHLVRHDAPLSVARGFKRLELQEMINQANVGQADITWVWAFRWLIVGRNPYAR